MTVGSFTPTDFTTQTGTAYKTAIDNNALVMKRVVDAFAPRQTTVPAMTISLDAGYVFKGVTLTAVAVQTSGTITAPVGNPRIDRAVVDRLTGALSIVTGTPNASPVAPAIPSGKIPVAQILLQTSSTSITNSMITDERCLWALGRGLVGEENIGAWLQDDGAGNLTLKVNATLQDDGSGNLSTSFTTEGTIASGSTTNLGSLSTNIQQVTGTATITSFGSSASAVDPIYILRFAAAATVQNNANIILQANVDFVATAGSFMILKYEGSGVWREIMHVKKDVVTAGSYTAANITVDALGNITAISNGSSSPAPDRQVFTGSGTWTKPSNFSPEARVLLEVIGGGGAGGNNSTTGAAGGNTSISTWIQATGGGGGTSAGVGGAGGKGTGQHGGVGGAVNANGGNAGNAGGGGGGSGTGVGGTGVTGGLGGAGGNAGVAGSTYGGGGGGDSTGGGGGGGGGYSFRWARLGDMGSTESVTIGAGGSGGVRSGAAGYARITVFG